MSREAEAALDGRIELKGLLGTGGMGEVHRAWDRGLERAVAVKFFLGAAPREAERLLLEGRLQARVEHPHVVRVLDAGLLEGRPCLVLQLVEGRSLDSATAGMSMAQRVELVRQAALGVHAAHLAGLVHRDVKPGNVLVEEGPGDPRALVSDFGLARGEEPGLTRSGLAPGTLEFMSPEQLAGEPVGFAADVYGLGSTLYAALAGHPPHTSRPSAAGSPALEPTELVRRVLEAAPPRLPRTVPRPLARVVSKAMERRPSARYESAEAFAADLARFQRGEAVMARPPSWIERALLWRRRNRAFAGAMAAAAVALVLSIGWGAWNLRKADLEALEAARLGALGESMEAALRMEYLSPPHDVRPALARVRTQVEALRSTEEKAGGPASYALGKGLQLLGDVGGARAAYERAWAKGFRSPRVAEGLGSSLAEQYRREHRRALESLEPSARAARLAVLKVELLDPAIRYLAMADDGGWRTSWLKASIALLEGDFSPARDRAAEAITTEPGRYEALVLQAESFEEEASLLVANGQLAEAEGPTARAGELVEEAARFGRSDPNIARQRIRALLQRLASRGEVPKALLQEIANAIALAKALDADDPAVLVFEAETLIHQVGRGYADVGGIERELQLCDQAIGLYRRAAELDGEQGDTLRGLAHALYGKAHVLKRSGRATLETVEQGLEVAARAIAKTPQSPEPYMASGWLHGIEAESLERQGKPSGPAWHQALEANEQALRLGSRRLAQIKRDIGEYRLSLAQEDWRSGRDPRPELDRAMTVLDDAHQTQNGLMATAVAALGHGTAAELLFWMGLDAKGKPELARALALAEKNLREHPQVDDLRGHLGEFLTVDVWHRALTGEDPQEPLREARRLFDSMGPYAEQDASFKENRAVLWLVEALIDRQRGRDGSKHLDRAERMLTELVSASPDAPPDRVQEYLARCALERAASATPRGQDARAAAREGLRWIDRALAVESRSPEQWAVRARLSAAAGDCAEAKRGLERAWQINPLAKGGPDSRLAIAEVEVCAQVGQSLATHASE